jgi:Na+/melibiose symporter-like transporter
MPVGVESPAETKSTDVTGKSVAERHSVSERSPLLSAHDNQTGTVETQEKGPNFYRCIFSKPNFTGGVYCSFISGLLTAIFNATVPLHTRDAFNWGGVQSGLIFAALQAPRLVMSPLVGWLKDRVGTRMPTVCGFTILAPFIWLLGVPGSKQFLSTSFENWGPEVYVIAMVCIGFQLTFLNGSGTIEATGKPNASSRPYFQDEIK